MRIPRLLPAALLCAPLAAGAQAIFQDGFDPAPVVPPAYDCNVEGILPSHMNLQMSTWRGTFSSPDGSPAATYPNGVSFPTPVGALRTYMRVVPFTPNASQSVLMYWDEVQSRQQDGYFPGRPSDGMWFAISPCIGDMRAPAYTGDPWLLPGCRKFDRSASMIWTTAASVAGSDAVQCKLEAGRTYYMTISPTNVIDGLQFGEHTCINSSDFGCDVGVVLQASNAN